MGTHAANGRPTVAAPAHIAGATHGHHAQPHGGSRRTGAVRHHRRQQQDEVERAERGYQEVMKDDDEGDEVLEDVEDAEEDVADNISNC